MAKPKLNTDDILQAEFNYIANSAFQANEDRSRVTSFYFVSVGSLVAAILGIQFGGAASRSVSVAFALLFAALSALGALTIAQLARLRAAWHEAIEAMNQVKDFYLKHHPEIRPAFKWGRKSIPPTNKPYSIANLLAVEVAMLSSLTTGGAVYFLVQSLAGDTWLSWLLTALSLVVSYSAMWAWYKYLLVDDR